MLTPVRTSAPAATPISLTEVKANCRIEDTDDDTHLTHLIDVAVSYVDGWDGIGIAMITQTWRQDYEAFGTLPLAIAPVQSISSVQYYDSNNEQQTLSTSVYTFLTDDLDSYITLQADQSWPATYNRPDAVRVTYIAGYGTAGSSVPAAIRQAMLLMIGHWNENREDSIVGAVINEIPLGAKILLQNYRRLRF